MAISGSFTTGETDGRSITVNWWRNSVTDNTSNIGWSVVGSGSVGGWVTCGNMYLEMNGTVVLNDSTRINVYQGTVCYSGSINMVHDANGAKSFWLSFAAGIYYVDQNSYASGTSVIDRIPLAPTIVGLTADTITANSVRVGSEISTFGHGTSAAARIYYRTYPSGSWLSTADQNDASGYNYWTITGLAAYQVYEYKSYWWNNNGDASYSAPLTFTTLGYANYTNGTPYCETFHSNSIDVAVCVDTTCDSLAISVDGGSWIYHNGDFLGWKVTTISSLSPGVQHSFKTSIRRKDSQLWKESNIFYGTTLSHSAITATTGNVNDTATSVSISFTNPTATPVDVYLELPDLGSTMYKRTYNVTSPVTLTLDSATMDSMLAAMTSVKSTKLRYVVHDSLDGVDTLTTMDYLLTVVDANPVFTNFTYLDSDTTISDKTENNQYIVQNYSDLHAVISISDKAVALKGSTIARYTFNINGINVEQAYSESEINKAIGVITAASDQILTVTAYDSRGNVTAVAKTIFVVPYAIPIINSSGVRLNNFENDTTLVVGGSFSPVVVNSVSKNTIASDKVTYRYKKDSDAFGDWITMDRQVGAGIFTTTDEYLDLDNTSSYTFEVNVEDLFDNNTSTFVVGRGRPILMIGSNVNSIGIGTIPTEENVVDVSDDILMKSSIEAKDHYDGSEPRVVNVCYGTSETPPSAVTTPGGTIYIQYSD